VRPSSRYTAKEKTNCLHPNTALHLFVFDPEHQINTAPNPFIFSLPPCAPLHIPNPSEFVQTSGLLKGLVFSFPAL
jgi:hypothetical protein